MTTVNIYWQVPRSGNLPVLFLLSSQKSTFCPLAEKLWIGSKNGSTFYDGHDELYHHAKFGEDRTMHTGCRYENVVFVFFCHTPSPELRAFEGCIVRTRIALPFIGQFRRGLQHFFHKRLLFQTRHIVLRFIASWRHNFREIVVKNCEKSKNRQKSLCTPFHIDSWEISRNSIAVV